MENIFAHNINEISNAIDKINENAEVKSVMILQADNMHPSKEEMDLVLKKCKKNVIGGLFPEIIVKGKQVGEGTLFIPFSFEIDTMLLDFENSYSDEISINKALKDKFQHRDLSKHNLLLFIDAFADIKSEFIHSLFNFFGITVNYIGGGTGSLSTDKLPCIFTNDGATQNAAVIGIMKNKIAMGVSHGWRAISDSLKVTEMNKNRIVSLDWRPAFEVYKEIIEKHSDIKFNGSNFSNISKSYPIGMVKLDSEMIIRDVLSVSENDLLLLDNIEEGDYINIMHGDINSLLNSAKNAKLQSDDAEIIDSEHQDFCIDCITRAYYLKDQFNDEIEMIKGSSELNGILSLGEIANNGETFLEIYNKTIVVSRWKMKD
jgi:hypothetical protein